MFIQQLNVFPVKGLQGFSPQRWEITETGLRFDRYWMIVNESTGAFASQRNIPAMAKIRATLSSDLTRLLLDAGDWTWACAVDATGEERKTSVWGDAVRAIDLGDEIARRLSKSLQHKVRLVRFPDVGTRGVDPFWAGDENSTTHFADFAPVLVSSMASLHDFNRRRHSAGMPPIPMSRFRANVVLDGLDQHDAWREDGWAGVELEDVMLQFIKPCARCKVTEIDQEAGVPMGEKVLDTLAEFRVQKTRSNQQGIMFGMNAIPRLSVGKKAAIVRVGANVTVTHPKMR
jgi:uncharacterized protein